MQVNPNPIVIHESSRSTFLIVAEQVLLSAPEWVSRHIQVVRQTLDGIPSNISSNYTYAPKKKCEGLTIKLECTERSYKLTLKYNEAIILPALRQLQIASAASESLPETDPPKQRNPEIVYSGPVTPASVNQFPQDLRYQAQQLTKRGFTYTTTITSDGTVVVGGTQTATTKTTSISDFLKQQRENMK